MSASDRVLNLRKEEVFTVPVAASVNNLFKDASIPQHPCMADNNYGSPHQDSWCSESVSLAGPVSVTSEETGMKSKNDRLLLIEQFNPYGYTPNMVCNKNNQMIGVSLNYDEQKFYLVVFDTNCNIISASPLGSMKRGSFGGGYFYLDNNDNTIIVYSTYTYQPDNDGKITQLVTGSYIASYRTQHVHKDRNGNISSLEPKWTSDEIIGLVTKQTGPFNNSLYSCLPVWPIDNTAPDENAKVQYWCLLAGDKDSISENPAYMAVVEIDPNSGNTTLIDAYPLVDQWNNNTFAVDDKGAYIVTNDTSGKKIGYLWAFELNDNKISLRWPQASYQNAGYLKPGQTNIGSGTTPTLTMADDKKTELVAITDNADPQLHIVVYDRNTGKKLAQKACFEKRRSADEASLIGVGNYFIAENNFGHYPTYPRSQYVPNGPGMEMIKVERFDEPMGQQSEEQSASKEGILWTAKEEWSLPNIHFYAMNMLCRENGIIFAHTCDWSDDISSTKGGMYYISAIDSYNGHVIWRIPLGRGVDYCHEYGGIYFNPNGDVFIGTNQYIISIKNFNERMKSIGKTLAPDAGTSDS